MPQYLAFQGACTFTLAALRYGRYPIKVVVYGIRAFRTVVAICGHYLYRYNNALYIHGCRFLWCFSASVACTFNLSSIDYHLQMIYGWRYTRALKLKVFVNAKGLDVLLGAVLLVRTYSIRYMYTYMYTARAVDMFFTCSIYKASCIH